MMSVTYKKSLLKLSLISAIVIGILFLFPSHSSALSGSEFNAGKIIDDAVFYNDNSMSIPEIQAFLNSKVPSCDTNGTQMYNSTQTRAQWAAANGRPLPPYTCLKDYTQNIPSIINGGSDLCTTSITGGSKNAAQIIHDVAQACGINPQVLIVLLQKEQSLVTDTWPWPTQYQAATGYGCPDTAPCDAEFYGFYNQVYQAAKAFRRYEANPNSYNYKANRNNFIYYNPNLSGCGGSNVYIHNQATASLYIYTPYQPNTAALNNLYGTGDSCSAYGNRNFWRMFNDWFGSTLATSALIQSGISVNIVSQPYSTPAIGQVMNYTVSYTNNLSFQITLNAVGVVARAGSMTTGTNRDFGWQGPITLPIGATQQFTFTITNYDAGAIHMWPAIYFQGDYIQYNNWGTTINGHVPNFSLTPILSHSPATVYAEQDITFSTTLKNNEAFPITYDAIGIPVRFYDTYNYDAAWIGSGIISPGAEIPIVGIRNLDKPGPFKYWVSSYFGGSFSTIGSVKSFNALPLIPNFSVSGLSLTPNSPAQGGDIAASFTVTNNLPVPITVSAVGVVGRLGTFTGANRDIGWQGPVTFAANETKTFTGYSRTITEVSAHHYWIGVLHQGSYIQYNNWGSTIFSRAP
jgi:hypothetical protein